MCNVGTINQNVVDVVTEFAQQGKVFTAYDVTVEARKRCPNENIGHRSTREYLRSLLDCSTMTQTHQATLVTLNVAGNPQAFVYHPINVDPYSHPLAVRPVDIQDDGSDDNTDSDDDSEEDGRCYVTADGRLNIPRSVMKKCVSLGGSYDLSVDGSVVCKKPNKDGRIRISVKNRKVNDFTITANVSKNIIEIESA